MNGIRLFVLSRCPVPLLGVLAALTALTALQPAGGIEFDYDKTGAARYLPFIELFPVLGACLVAALLRPRFHEWDRLGTWRPRVGVAATVLVGAALPVIPVLLGALRLPPQATWGYAPPNVVIVAAVAFALCALVGPAVGASLTALLFVGVCLLQDAAPAAVAFVPLAAPPATQGHWAAAIGATAVAVVVQVTTGGASGLARRSIRNQE